MRDVLFRGMRIVNGEWVYGNLVTCHGVPYIFPENTIIKGLDIDGWLNGCQMIEVVPETVGQWTGLCDYNGVRIFEGDILDTTCYTVAYVADVNESKGMYAGWYVQRHNFEGWYELECHEGHVVLGNPWENPELMKR